MDTDVLQALPALFSEPLSTEEDLIENAVPAPDPINQYAAELERALQEKQDLIIDFTSLKTCLDPTSTFENQPQSVSINSRLFSVWNIKLLDSLTIHL
jgi:hypothetical protein